MGYYNQVKPSKVLTPSWRRSLSYRNQSIDFQSKSMNWFLYDRDLCHERVKRLHFNFLLLDICSKKLILSCFKLKKITYFHLIYENNLFGKIYSSQRVLYVNNR